MADRLEHIRRFMRAEANALVVEAERARLWDNNTNRGNEAEWAVLRWLRKRVEPQFTVSSGEIVDSVGTNAEKGRRQLDGIIHKNDAGGNRFAMPSGMRLVPIEAVAMVVEVKLTLDLDEFRKTDANAGEVKRLSRAVLRKGQPEDGLVPANAQPQDLLDATTFAVFSFGGVTQVETLAKWLQDATTIRLVCCLEAGCAFRKPREQKGCSVVRRDDALPMFARHVDVAIANYKQAVSWFDLRYTEYDVDRHVTFNDETDYEFPPGYQPLEWEVERLHEWNATREGPKKGPK